MTNYGEQLFQFHRILAQSNSLVHMYYVYVLYSRGNDKFYIGCTENLQRRLKEHKSKSNHTTSRFPDVDLVFHEVFIAKEDAVRRELYFKTTKGKRSLRFILKSSLDKIDGLPGGVIGNTPEFGSGF